PYGGADDQREENVPQIQGERKPTEIADNQRDDKSGTYTESSADQGYNDRFRKKLEYNVFFLRAYDPPDPDLQLPLGNRKKHDRKNPESSYKERYSRRDYGENGHKSNALFLRLHNVIHGKY